MARAAAGTPMYAGLDVGGTFLKAALMDAEGVLHERLEEPTRKQTAEELFAQLAGAVRTLAGRQPASVLQGVGVGLPAIVDRQSRVRVAPNVHVLDGASVGEELQRRTGVPTAAENDANAAALAEAYRGAGRGVQDVLFVTLGTGVGAGVVLGGRVWAGTSGYAGELGHIQVDEDGVPCGCGSHGCVETIAGIPGWERRARERLAAGRVSVLRERPELDPKTIVEAAQAGDALALELVDEAARAVAIGVASGIQILNPQRVIIGGGVSRAGQFLLGRIVAHVKTRTFPPVFADCSFRLAELGSDAGVVGACTVAAIELPHRH